MTTLLWILAGVAGTVVMMGASRFAVRHAVAAAEELHVSPFLIGFTLVALGTDMPEIFNWRGNQWQRCLAKRRFKMMGSSVSGRTKR